MNEPILIVDDNAANIRLMSYILSSKGFDVRCASDAREALAALESFLPRLILMDLQMPGMDGLELTRLLKSAPRTRDILVVAVTAYAMKGDEERARAAGCDGYITKPIDTRGLPGTVSAYLERGSSSEKS